MKNSEGSPGLICAGEFFLDLIFHGLEDLPTLGQELKTDNFAFSLGGGAAITAAAAARLEQETGLLTAWGDSALDQAARDNLSSFGVDALGSKVHEGLTSGLTVAVSTTADRYFLTCPGANRFVEDLILSPDAFEVLSRADHVHLALTPTNWAPFRLLSKELQARDATVSWDLGWDPEAAESSDFRRICKELDVLFLNEMEALRYTNSETVQLALERFSSSRNVVVIKRGARGVIASESGAASVEAAGLEVEVVDTTGAGDAFNGGFLQAWMKQRPLKDCLRAGNICGGLSTRQPGGVASLPSREEFESRLGAIP